MTVDGSARLTTAQQGRQDRRREEYRILRAVKANRLTENESGRYVIAGEPRPAFKVRKSLENRGLIRWCASYQRAHVSVAYKITQKGLVRLAELDADAHDHSLGVSA